VVQILLAPGCIGPRGLEMTPWIRADPDIPPGRRNGKPAQPLERLRIGDRPAVLGRIAEAPTAPDPAIARSRAVGAAEAWSGGACQSYADLPAGVMRVS
jgi:hypothetical protein